MADGFDGLVRQALAVADRDDEARWRIVRELHGRADRAGFEAAVRLAGSAVLEERLLGLDILGQFGYAAGKPYLAATLPIMVDACAEDQPVVLAAAIAACGHLADERLLGVVLRHQRHPSADVRYHVAVALPSLAGDPPAAEGVQALIQLSGDPDPDVRDWATFGLGSQLDVDGEAVRAALAARLEDHEGDSAGEALVGLARRHDRRALTPLLAWLDADPGNLVVEAAALLAAPEALPALLRLKQAGWQNGDPRPNWLDEAIEACTPRDENLPQPGDHAN